MRARELYESKVGRTIQHVEDLVFVDGVAGVEHAVNRLIAAAQTPSRMTIKWDGTPGIIFGRNEDGTLHLSDVHAKEPIRSAEELKDLYLNRRGEMTSDRRKFIGRMVRLYSQLEGAVPDGFRGYVTGDLMYWDTPEKVGNEYTFAPNVVRYYVDADSELGQKIGQSKVGIAVHGRKASVTDQATPVGDALKGLGSTDVVMLPPVYGVQSPVKVNTTRLKSVLQKAKQNQLAIEAFIEPEKGLSDVRNIIYTYVNQTAAKKGLAKVGDDFRAWIENNPRLSDGKKAKMLQRLDDNAAGAKAMFDVVRGLVVAKKEFLAKAEGPTLKGHGIRAELSSAAGGEGFVDPDDERPLKYVDREGFRSAVKEDTGLQKLVVMPGGFHPFHAGHRALYDAAAARFPDAQVIVSSSDDVSKRPFPFAAKRFLAGLAGVPARHFVKVARPFVADEYEHLVDPNNTALIFVRSEKDAGDYPKPGDPNAVVTKGPRKGKPPYILAYEESNLLPMTEHAYIEYLPTIEFKAGGTVSSASEIRAAWLKASDKKKDAILRALYPAADEGKLRKARDLFDRYIR